MIIKKEWKEIQFVFAWQLTHLVGFVPPRTDSFYHAIDKYILAAAVVVLGYLAKANKFLT